MSAMRAARRTRLPKPPPYGPGSGTPGLPDLPIYALTDAARLTQFCTLTVRRWTAGGHYRYRGEIRPIQGMIGCAPRMIGGVPHVTFRQLLSLRLMKGMRAAGLSMRTIRRITLMAAAAAGEPLPMATLRFRADGAEAFAALEPLRRADPDPPPLDEDLPQDESWGIVFTEMVDRALFDDVDWVDGMPARWWPMGREFAVALDPRVAGGMPHIAGSRVRTVLIAGDLRASGGGEAAIPTVAAAHGVTARQVRDAARFETAWLAPEPPVRSGSSPAPEAPAEPSEHPEPSPPARRRRPGGSGRCA
jgi:uncharacterized protein (DUF433 family)